jgi:hypothetical protein
LPFTSVTVTTVLLNVDWMCAMPVATFFLTFFFGAFPFAEAGPAEPVLPAVDIFALYP